MTQHPLDLFGMTDVGNVRAKNEDQFIIAELRKSLVVRQSSLPNAEYASRVGERRGYLLAVADGMGGAPAGERASAIAVNALTAYVLNAMPRFLRMEVGEEGLKEAVEVCQSKIEADVHEHPELRGMGTTLTVAYIVWPRAYVVHVGDGRCYLSRGGKLMQITRDHSIAQNLVEEGVLKSEAARASRWSSIIWNVVGGSSSQLDPEVHKIELQAKDTILLCTDGVTKHVDEAIIGDLLQGERPAEAICRVLVEAAKGAGGTDNITAIVGRLGTTPAQE